LCGLDSKGVVHFGRDPANRVMNQGLCQLSHACKVA
jgi:hypothetical protein